MKRTAALVGLAGVLAFAASAAASPIPNLAFTARDTRPLHACTRSVPDLWGPIILWVYVNGQPLESPSQTVQHTQYFAGDGTLVRLHEVPHNGPVCARAITWLRSARILVRFQLLY